MAIANKTCVSGKKAEGWRYVLAVEAFYLYAKLIFGRPLRVNFVSTRKTGNYYHKRRLFTNTSAMLSKYSFVYSVYLFIPAGVRVSLCRPNNVEFSRHAEKSISNEFSTVICTFWSPLVTPLRQSQYMSHGWKEDSMLVKASQHVPIYLQPFPSNSTRSSPF